MTTSRAAITILASVGLLAAAGLVRAGEGPVPTFPAGQDFKSPKPAKMPDAPLEKWKVVVAHAEAPVFKSFEGDAPLGAAKLKFGELAYVVAGTKQSPGKSARLLLGRFEDGEKFQNWIGWVDASAVIDRPQPLKVDDARKYLRDVVAKDHPFYERIGQVLPDASREDFKNVTLKAVTHPERGKACFSRPIPAAEYETASKTTDAVALQPFAFFYVYRIAVDAKNVFCLLGPRSEASMEADNLGDKFRQQLVGWVDMESLILWTTREAFEYSLEKPPLEFRRKSSRPIELYAKKNDLVDWWTWEQAGRKGENPVKPVYTEELDEAKAPLFMRAPWNPQWMRYPILSSFPLGDQSKGKWLGYQLCILGSTKSGGGTVADVEDMKKKLNDAVKDMRVFELVIVLDTTGSMGPVFNPVKDAVVKMVEELKKEATAHTDELKHIQLRVAVVLYKDHPAQNSDYLTKTSDDYFDVMTEPGLNSFKDWLGNKDKEAEGGGDELEEPFEGVQEAMKKFLVDGSKHKPGAARVLMVIGDSGNHDVGGDTKLSLNDILKSLEVVGEATIDKQKKQVAKVQLHSVMTLLSGEDLKKTRLGLKKWEEQIHALADKTGGTKHEVAFNDEEAKKASTDKLVAALKSALDARRSLMQVELAKIQDTPGASKGTVGGPELVIAKARLEEIIKGKGELDKLLKGLSSAFFTEVFAVEQTLGEPEELARLKLCILVSDREFLKIIASTQAMAEGLDEIVKKGGLGGGGEALEAKIKRLIVVTMLNAFGEDAAPGRIETLMKKTLPQIQREVSQLPVQFGILKTQPKTEEDLKKLVEALKIKAARLMDINANHRGTRIFYAGVATGEAHIWLYKTELP